MDKEVNLIESFQEGLRPTESLSVWEWADKYRMLSSVSSAEPGRWRTDRVPYMREIFQKLSPTDPCREVVFMKGVQIAGTEAALNLIGAYIDLEPCPIMYVMPTVDMAKQLSKKRLHHMIEECPTLRRKVAAENRRKGSSNQLEKMFTAGSLSLTGANSASGLRSNPVRVLVLDETDAYPLNVADEGSPIKLAEARTSTFAKNKKIFKLSTPTIAATSAISAALETTDKKRYMVPCPHCGSYQHLQWQNLKFEKDKPEEAKYECEHCEELIEERHKTKMLAAGYWESTVPENSSSRKAGYMINSLYSPLGWISWGVIASQFLDSKNDPIKLRTFVNTILGEPWEDRGDAPEWETIFNKREALPLNKPNNSVEMVTVGVDVQKDRLELEVVGWCRDKSTYSLDYRHIMGDTTERGVWDKLKEITQETWIREDGIELPMMMMAVDANYNTTYVYDFCRRVDTTKVIPIQGREAQRTILAPPKSVDVARSGKKVGGLKVWGVGVSVLKSELYAFLRLNQNEDETYPPGYCHFPEYGVEYFRGITAEQLTFRTVKGYRKHEWVKTYARNEPIDCRNYARAAATAVGIDRFNDQHWDKLTGRYKKVKEGHDNPVPQVKPIKKKKRPKSDYWAGR